MSPTPAKRNLAPGLLLRMLGELHMKKILLLVLLAAGMTLTAFPALAASPVLASPPFHGGHGRVIVNGGWPGWGWGWGWGYPGYAYERYGDSYGPAAWSRVKTDVEPDEARLYLDGRLIGTADDFDGWPDYLYLQRGHYRLEFRLSGYETKTVELDARPGQTLKIDDHLKKVAGAKQYGSYDEPKIEGSIRRYWAKRRNATEPINPEASRGDGHERAPAYDGDDDEEESQAPPADVRPRGDWRARPDATAEAPRAEARGARSRLRLHIEPADAAVYVDDRFVGTGEEVNSLDRGIAVPAGKHTVTVSRPGFKDRSVDVEVESGRSKPVDISLTR